MSEMDRRVGSIGWFDLTVPHAEAIRDFYSEVVGWQSSELPMQDYSDYCMHRPDDNQVVAGVCHAQGINADIPAVWLLYVNVQDLDQSLERVVAKGGEVVSPLRTMEGMGRMAIIRDPAGACLALFEHVSPT